MKKDRFVLILGPGSHKHVTFCSTGSQCRSAGVTWYFEDTSTLGRHGGSSGVAVVVMVAVVLY